jgi:GT2 family glycosyltransferase
MKKITAVTTVLCPSEDAFIVLRACMTSIRAAIDKVNGEYIIVDDGSAVGAEFFSTIGHKYIKNETTQGVSISLNKGMKAGSGECVVKIDSDYLVPENLFETLLRDWTEDLAFISPSYLYTSPEERRLLDVSLLPAPESGMYDRPGGMAHEYLKSASHYQWGGGVLMFSTEAIKKIGYFDENFGIGGSQDNDIIYRILLEGLNWRWDNNVVCRHFASVSSNDPASTQKWQVIRDIGIAYFTKKHGFAPGGFISTIYKKFGYKFEY